MTEYSEISGTRFGLRHNAVRASRRIAGAVVFPDGEGFRWGVPVSADEVPARCSACGEALGSLRCCLVQQEDDGCPKGDPDCLSDNGDCHDACEPVALREAVAAQRHERQAETLQVPAEPPTNEALAQAARDQAAVMGQDPAVAWLLREMADRLSALPVPKPRASALRMPGGGTARVVKPRGPRVPFDPTAKPVITSPTNQSAARLADKVEAARGDAEALRAFRISRSQTYYARVASYRDALLAEAEAGKP